MHDIKFKNDSEKENYLYLQSLKKEVDKYEKLTDEITGYVFFYHIIGRGEYLFFQMNEKALLIEISPAQGLLNISSIKKWDDASKVKADEVDIIKRIVNIFWRRVNPHDIKFVDKNGNSI